MMNILVATSWTALVLFILFETSAVFSYLSLLKPLNFLTKIREYRQEMGSNPTVSYAEYMNVHHGGFWVRMLSCRYCVGVWLALLFSVAMGSLFALPIVYFGGQLICSLFKVIDYLVNNHE